MSDGNEIDTADLPPKLRDHSQSLLQGHFEKKAAPAVTGKLSFYARVAAFEKSLLQEAYSANGGNIKQLALNLEMDRSHLYTKLKDYGIHPKRKTERPPA